jgi:hypothetical protein
MFDCSLCGGRFSGVDKRDEHQWLCSLRQHSSIRSFFCHCCNRQFKAEDDRNHHKVLCCLKLPPGSCLICQFCHIKIGIHSHSSFVHHEKHCSMNPASVVASSVLRRHRSLRECGETRSNYLVMKKQKSGDAPICVCSVDPARCVVSYSYSSGNPGRKYYHCSKFKNGDHCNFFDWCD